MRLPVKLTYADLEALPEDGKRYELHEGEVTVSAAPRLGHQQLCGRLFTRLDSYVAAGRHGVVLQAVDVYFSEDTVLNPDIVFVSTARRERLAGKFVRGAPDLAVEVLSPSTQERDLGIKLQVYAKCGVGEYWVFNSFSRSASVYGPDQGAFQLLASYGHDGVLKSRVLPGIELRLSEIWPDDLGDEEK